MITTSWEEIAASTFSVKVVPPKEDKSDMVVTLAEEATIGLSSIEPSRGRGMVM
jgi:hypothetical protein